MDDSFMRQFQAGWQLGMDKKQNARRDQEMMQRMQRDEFDMAQRQAQLKMQQEELRLQLSRLKQEDALKKLQLRQQSALPAGLSQPTAADAGIQQAVPDVGPPVSQINVPQPTQAVPFMDGDLQVPVLTGPQQDQMAQQAAEAEMLKKQQAMREALGFERDKILQKQELEPKGPDIKPVAGGYITVQDGKVKFTRTEAGAGGGPGGAQGYGLAKSEAEKNRVDVARYAIGKMPDWSKWVSENGDLFGPVAGRATEMRQKGYLRPFGAAPDAKVASKQAEFATMKNALVNALSGAAVSPAEFERLKEQIPNLTDPPEVVGAKLEVLDGYFRERIGNYGIQTAPRPAAPTSGGTDQEPPDA